ncbi:MAG: hypothetical protein LLG09_08030 [Negativicutes bacterium]|nr:hypothetical protein [Negativicutes bacterium]
MENIIRPVVHNRFDIEVADARTGEIKQCVTSYNIILDQYFTRLISRSSKIGYIHLGTGSGTPTVTRTSMFTFLGAMANTVVETVKAYPTSYTRRKIVLSPSDYVGARITEVGFGYSTSSGTAVTHSMLKDSEGNQIAIQKTDTDVLTVYATFYLTIGEAVPGVYVLPTPNNNAVISAVLQDSYSTLTLIMGAYDTLEQANDLSGISISSKTGISPSADQPNRKWQIPVTRWNYNEANSHMVSAIGSPTIAAWLLPNPDIFPQITLSNLPVGVGDGVATEFSCPIPKIVPNSEVVHIDNVLQTKGTDYAIDYDNNNIFYPELMLSADAKSHEPLITNTSGTDYRGSSDIPLIYPTTSYVDAVNSSRRVGVVTSNKYDFREAKAFNTLILNPYAVRYYGDSYSGTVKLKMLYSLDNQTWETCLVTELFDNEYSGFPPVKKTYRFETVTARYIAFQTLEANDTPTSKYFAIGDYATKNGVGYNILVGHTTPGLTFTSPPAAGASIEMDCAIDRPLKNENWVLDFSFAVQFERG